MTDDPRTAKDAIAKLDAAWAKSMPVFWKVVTRCDGYEVGPAFLLDTDAHDAEWISLSHDLWPAVRERAETAERRAEREHDAVLEAQRQHQDTKDRLRWSEAENRRLRDALAHTLSGCTVYRCPECDAARAALAATEDTE